MKKYYIKSLFTDWKEVSKEKYHSYRNHIIEKCVVGTPENLADKYTKVVEE